MVAPVKIGKARKNRRRSVVLKNKNVPDGQVVVGVPAKIFKTNKEEGNMDKLAVFSGNAHPELAKDICKYLKVKLSDALVGDSAKERYGSRSMRMCAAKMYL